MGPAPQIGRLLKTRSRRQLSFHHAYIVTMHCQSYRSTRHESLRHIHQPASEVLCDAFAQPIQAGTAGNAAVEEISYSAIVKKSVITPATGERGHLQVDGPYVHELTSLHLTLGIPVLGEQVLQSLDGQETLQPGIFVLVPHEKSHVGIVRLIP